MKKQFFTETRSCYQVIENNIVPRKLVLLYFKFPLKFLSLYPRGQACVILIWTLTLSSCV